MGDEQILQKVTSQYTNFNHSESTKHPSLKSAKQILVKTKSVQNFLQPKPVEISHEVFHNFITSSQL